MNGARSGDARGTSGGGASGPTKLPRTAVGQTRGGEGIHEGHMPIEHMPTIQVVPLQHG